VSYITRTDLLDALSEQQLVQLTDDDKLGIADETKISKAITDADAEINGYIATRYAVPITPATDLVKKFSKTIAVKNLWARRQRVPETVRQDYDDVVAQLRDIAKGVITLGVDPAPAESAKSSAGEVSGPERVFDRDKLGGF